MLEAATSLISEIFIDIYKETKTSLINKAISLDLFGTIAREYSERVYDRYSFIKIMGMNAPIPLKDLYVRANVLHKRTIQNRITIEALEMEFNKDRRGFGVKSGTRDAEELVNEFNKFIILGKPGAGKTTFLKYLLLQSIEKAQNLKQKRIPVFVSLKELSDSNLHLYDFILNEFRVKQHDNLGSFIDRVFEHGKFQILLDGLDEVSSEKQDFILDQIKQITFKFQKCQYIISCRIAAYNYFFENFTDVEISDFDDRQIKKFIENWFKNESEIAEQCWEKVIESKNLKELAATPLLLTLLCIAYDDGYDFPNNRAELYKEAIDALLKKWDSSRRIKRDYAYNNLSLKRKESLLSRIAIETFTKDEYFISEKRLIKLISAYIENLPDTNLDNIISDSEGILRSIEAQHGVLVERAYKIFSFSHLTFQEYFTAQYIIDNRSQLDYDEFLRTHLIEDKWREVILLISGMLDSADNFVLAMNRQVDNIAKENRKSIGKLLHFMNAIQGKSSDYFERIKAISLAFGQMLSTMNIRRLEDTSNDLQSIRSLLLQIGKTLRPLYKKENRRLELQTSNVITMQGSLFTISKEEFQILIQYLKATSILVNCLQAESYITKDLRNKILEDLFLIKS